MGLDNDQPYNAFFTIKELKIVLNSKKSSAPGADTIHYEMLKQLPEKNKFTLLKLINKSWEKGELAGHFKKAIRMLSMVYSRKWYQGCSLCGELTLSKVEHTILFCPATTEIRNAFWLRLLKRFGLRFYASFINNTPLRQLDMLFSGCYDLFENESDVFDCLKMCV